MKKLSIITASVIFLTVTVFLIADNCFFRHTPESVLKVNFSISLKDFDYSVETFEEQWCPNGDGQALIVFKFSNLTQENIDYLKGFDLKSLPVSDKERKSMAFNEIPQEYFNIDTGYYIYKRLSDYDSADYKVFIIDTGKKMAVLYYQYI